MSVRQPEILAYIKLQYPRCICGLLLAPLDGATSSHLAACDIERTSAVTKVLHLQKRPADRQLHIVRLREYRKNIYFHCTLLESNYYIMLWQLEIAAWN